MSGRPFSLILLPTLECNVACDYCFKEKAKIRLSHDQVAGLTTTILDHMEAVGSKHAEIVDREHRNLGVGHAEHHRTGSRFPKSSQVGNMN